MSGLSEELSGDSRVAVTWQDLCDAFLFVNAGPVGENSARISLKTGRIRQESAWVDIWEDPAEQVPDDLAGDDEILDIPHKTELGLGRDLVLWFVEEIIPDSYEDVADFFRKRGAYAKFKALLAEQGLLQQWYDFENQAEEQALRNWCEENGVTIIEEGES